MDQKEQAQKVRLKEFEPFLKTLDLSKYGYAFEHGPIKEWISDVSGNMDTYVWRQNGGSLRLNISVLAHFEARHDGPDSDYLTASISGPDESEGYLDLNLFEEEKNHPLKLACYNRDNKSIGEFTKKYVETLMEALDTYLNDFIMGRRFETTKFDRGDY